jgi:hypothetical protein
MTCPVGGNAGHEQQDGSHHPVRLTALTVPLIVITSGWCRSDDLSRPTPVTSHAAAHLRHVRCEATAVLTGIDDDLR